eukprot:NODE_32_length_32166_cov_0.707737.p19 type:complete len:120 gc:universal NODE_32_length_32166_cov_0.707737:31969-31610(-)
MGCAGLWGVGGARGGSGYTREGDLSRWELDRSAALPRATGAWRAGAERASARRRSKVHGVPAGTLGKHGQTPEGLQKGARRTGSGGAARWTDTGNRSSDSGETRSAEENTWAWKHALCR